MSVVAGDAIWRIGGDTRDLEKALDEARTAVAGMMTAAGAAITASLGLAAKQAASFGKLMANVSTLGVTNLAELDRGARDVAKAYGIDLNDAAAAVYETISAGIPQDAAVLVMEKAAKGAQAGVGSLADALDLGTSVMNAWNIMGKNANDTAAQMEKIMGMAATAAFKGKTTFAEMATSIGQVAPITAAAGIKVEEFFAALSGLTATGLPTSSAMTQLQQVISNIIKPSTSAAKMAAALGIEFNAAALKSKGLVGMLDEIARATGGDLELMGQLFGSTEALGAVIALTGNQAGLFKETLEEMGKAQQTLNEMSAAYVKNNPELAFAQLKATVQDLAIVVGRAVLPALIQFVNFVEPIVESVIKWIEGNSNLSTTMILVAGAIGLALTVLGPLLLMLPGIATAFALLQPPIMLAVAAITAIGAAVIAGLVALYQWAREWYAVPENAQRVADGLNTAGEWIAAAWEWIVGAFQSATDWVMGIVAQFRDWLDANWQQITEIFSTAVDGLLIIGNMLWEGLKLAFDLLWTFLSNVFQEIGEGFTSMTAITGDESATFLDYIQYLQERGIEILTFLQTGFNNLLAFIRWIWPVINKIMDLGCNLFIEPVFAMANRFQRAYDNIAWLFGKIQGMWNWLTGSGAAAPVQIPGGPPGMATGGVVQRAGWAMVGERGPELVNLPRGATVYDADQTKAAGGGGNSITINFGRDSVRSDNDIREIERGITRVLGGGLQAAGVRML